MTTSGSTDFELNRDEVINAAARKVNAIRAGATMNHQMRQDFSQALNILIKHFQGRGIRIWNVEEATLFPQPNQVQYGVGSSATDHITKSYVSTTLSAAEAQGQTVLSVSSVAGISANDNFGVIVDDGTLHWSTVSSVGSDTVTINDALDDDAASGSTVFAYTSKVVRPLKIVNARRYEISSGLETPVWMASRQEYRDQPDKTSTGNINQLFYDPKHPQGQVYFWQALTAVTELVNFTFHEPVEDFDAASDTPDFPVEWTQCLIFNLALVMAPEFEVPRDKMEGPFGIGTLAEKYLDDMEGWDRENESVHFGLEIE